LSSGFLIFFVAIFLGNPDNSSMIKKLKPHLYVADKNDLCSEDTLFIRQAPEELYHICDRAKTAFGGEQYLVGRVKFDYTLGEYHCTRDGCWQKLELIDVWSDPEFTGWESRC